MGDCCQCHSEISRDGSGQLNRYLKALDPAYAPVDDRSIEELLVFTKRYANQIRFYDIPDSNMPGGEDETKISWREFFRRDVAVIAASLSQTDIWQLKKDYDELRAKLDAHPSHNTFGALFDPILGMAIKIDNWYALSISENPLYADLQLAINSNLKGQMQKIVAYEEGFKYVDLKHPLNLDYAAIKNKDIWGLNDTINADISIYEGADAAEKILNAGLYIDDVFNNFYGFISQLIANSESYMQFALEQYPKHQPHMALFIAFLQLFRLAQEQMKGITGRMLDFYYRDVLRLTPKPSIPDKVHIVFELAKDVASYNVAPDTSLKAGKDALGKDEIYATETDLVVNQAKVKEIKNVFIQKVPTTEVDANGNKIQIVQNIYAQPAANSKDGFGEKFTEPNLKWPTFGKGNAAFNTSNNLCDQVALIDDVDRADQAQIGFAIASPQLVLYGGNRLLKIGFELNDDSLFVKAKDFETQNVGKSFFQILLTGEKGWITIEDILSQNEFDNLLVTYTPAGGTPEVLGIFNPDLDKIKGAYYLDAVNNSIVVYLPVSEQPVIRFDPKAHPGYDFKTPYPVIKILVNQPLNLEENDYKNFMFSRIDIQSKVGSINPSGEKQKEVTGSGQFPSTDNLFTYHYDGLESLIIQNENGLVQLGKPFDPFTAYPAQGKSFYIGSEETFNKPLGKLAVNINKTQQSGFDLSQFGSGIFGVSVLHNKKWEELSNENGNDFDQEHLTINILNHAEFPDFEGSPDITPVTLPRTPIQYFTQWQLQTEKGFLQIVYEQETSSDLQSRQSLAIGLEIKEVSLSYESELLGLDPAIDQFFHIYPFGVVETYLETPSFRNSGAGLSNIFSFNTDFTTLDKLKQGLLVNAGNALLPQFNFLSPYSKYYDNTISSFQTSSQRFSSSLGTRLGAIQRSSTSANAVGLLLDARSNIENRSNQYIGDMQEGMLFIGLEKLQPLQSISMLFQFAEGSAENEDDDPPTINWSYLTYNEWRPLKAENIVSDGTYGFQTTGIIKIDIPADASAYNTIITNGLIWLCASVTKNANRIPQLIDIVTQAVEAKFKDQNNDPSHFDNVLPAASITKLSTPVAEISKVQQPFASFDGKHQEAGKEFYTRVSERLRHKRRAINAWDYEHLVLNRFPSIYKIKCITHTDPNCLCTNKSLTTVNSVLPKTVLFNGDNVTMAASLNMVADEVNKNPLLNITLIGHGSHASANVENVVNAYADGNLGGIPIFKIDLSRISVKTVEEGNNISVDIIETENCCGPQIAPGHVLLIPIANLKNRNAANPLQPKTSRRTLIEIQEYLKKLTSPFVHVYAKNPVYEQIIVSFKVQFYAGIDKGYYMKKLNDEIVHFLTPWAFDENAEVTFNQKIYASSIINFIEERSYVDFITDFIMGVCCNECCQPLETAGIGVINGTAFDNEKMLNPLKNIIIKIKETDKMVTTDADGKYTIANIPPGSYTLLAYFSLFNIATQNFTIDANGNATPATIDFYEGGGNRQEDIAGYLSNFCGCESIERFLKYDPNFKGDIVAQPCTSRSLLVSVPQHIIIPFEEDTEPSPCEKRKASQTSIRTASRMITGTRVADSLAATSVKTTAKTASAKSKRASETASVKSSPQGVKKIKTSTTKSAKSKKPK